MLHLVTLALKYTRHGVKLHHHVVTNPGKHKSAIAGHLCEVAAVACHAIDWPAVEISTGLLGAALLLFHVVTTEI